MAVLMALLSGAWCQKRSFFGNQFWLRRIRQQRGAHNIRKLKANIVCMILLQVTKAIMEKLRQYLFSYFRFSTRHLQRQDSLSKSQY